jgi:hypothetical protein
MSVKAPETENGSRRKASRAYKEDISSRLIRDREKERFS